MAGQANTVDTFPPSLLTRPRSERYEYFENYSVAHTVLEKCFEKLMQTIWMPAGKRLVFIIGPPGVGKTFLSQWVEDEVKAHWAKKQHQDRGRIPFVGIEVPSKDRIKPSCGDIYLRLLRALEEPLINKKIIYGDVVLHRTLDNQIAVNSRATATKLRYALEQALEHRKPFVLSMDEAQHLMNLAGLSLEELMDWLKSFANMCKVLIALFGTYEMFDLLDLSDQLMRRSKIIHLRRYSNKDEDLISFQRTVISFQQNMPLKKEPDLLAHYEYLYERTAGCVGNLYEWLLAAFNLALQESKVETLSYRHLRECAPLTALRAAKMNQSIEEDELLFLKEVGEDDVDDEDERAVSSAHIDKTEKSLNSENGKAKSSAKKTRKGRVGKRLPKRDRTGRKH